MTLQLDKKDQVKLIESILNTGAFPDNLVEVWQTVQPFPISSSTSTSNSLAQLQQNLAKRLNPYPNMSRHRVLYMLDRAADNLIVRCYKGYVRKDGSYFTKNLLDIEKLTENQGKKSLPVFITINDLAIFKQILRLKANKTSDESGFVIAQQDEAEILPILVDTGHCFWQSCEQGPLKISRQVSSEYTVNSYRIESAQNVLVKSICLDQVEESYRHVRAQLGHVIIKQGREAIPTDFVRLEVGIDDLSEPDSNREQQVFDIEDLCFIADHLLQSQMTYSQGNALLQILMPCSHLLPVASSYQVLDHAELKAGDLLLPTNELLAWFKTVRHQQLHINLLDSFISQGQIRNQWYLKIGELETDRAHADLDFGVMRHDSESDIVKHLSLLPFLSEILKSDTAQANDHIQIRIDQQEHISISYDQLQLIQSFLADWQSRRSTVIVQSDLVRWHALAHELNAKQALAPDIETRLKRWLALEKPLEHVTCDGILQTTLRPYQQQGVTWLNQLRQLGVGGILADDMGLGKTLQTIAFINYIAKNTRSCSVKQRSKTLKCLVVVPTSLIGNWMAEFAQFAPDIRIAKFYGSQRNEMRYFLDHSLLDSDLLDRKFLDRDLIDQEPLDKDLLDQDLLDRDLLNQEPEVFITSYGTLLRDESLMQQNWDLCVFDEAHMLKNHRSKIRKAAKMLPSQQNIALTGTPMENHLGELWSLLDLVAPNYLGSYASFNKQYKKPIESNKVMTLEGVKTESSKGITKEQHIQSVAQYRLQALQQRIAPLMLRRTKAEVAQHLPEKTEVVKLLQLAEQQAQVYDAIRLASINTVQRDLDNNSAKAQFHIANAILKLRQACCHSQLALAPKVDAGASTLVDVEGNASEDDQTIENHSVKIHWLQQHIPQMVETGRKVLIFSSFTRMLDLIELALKEQGIQIAKLTGQSKNRDKIINSFQMGDVPVFLISLKAGGVGLNLTAADTVIHVDPWWNPAAESQATDRAHRLGQYKPVFVYKLIAENTIEQAIQQLQYKKKILADELFLSDGLSQSDVAVAQWIKILGSN